MNANQPNKFRQGVYLLGLMLESANRGAAILNKPEPVKRKVIHRIYRLGRLLP